MNSIEKSEKFAPADRYLNISVFWIFYFKQVIRIFYRLRVPHEVVTLAAIAIGFLAAYLYYHGYLIAAAVALHLKDIFDASDGALARLTGRGHLIGRYLDSVGDFAALTAVLAAISARAVHQISDIYLFWGCLAWLSLFIQCSFFNYYQLVYAEQVGRKRLSSERDERARDDLDEYADKPLQKHLLVSLRFLYAAVFGWQDKFVAAVDRRLRSMGGDMPEEYWYGDRVMMTLCSPLCFGTHIFIMIVCALLGAPQYALIFISTAMNGYLIAVLFYRLARSNRQRQRPGRGADTI